MKSKKFYHEDDDEQFSFKRSHKNNSHISNKKHCPNYHKHLCPKKRRYQYICRGKEFNQNEQDIINEMKVDGWSFNRHILPLENDDLFEVILEFKKKI